VPVTSIAEEHCFLFSLLNNLASIFSPYLDIFTLLMTEKLPTSSTSPSELEHFDWNLLHFFSQRSICSSFITVKKCTFYRWLFKGQIFLKSKKKD